LTVLSVDEHETAVSSEGVVIRGVVHFKTDIRPYFDPSRMVLGVEAEHEENHPLNDASRRDPWFDLRDLSIEFQLTVSRTQSQKVVQAVQQINANPNLAPAFAPAAAVLTAYDGNLLDPPPSDYASTEFVLDFIIIAALHAPFLRGATRAEWSTRAGSTERAGDVYGAQAKDTPVAGFGDE
jgi:hypothetical protein